MEDKEEGGGEPSAKAVKADNLKVPVHLWNDWIAQKLMRYWEEKGLTSKRWKLKEKENCKKFDHFCDVLWKGILKFQKNKVKKDFWKWYKEKGRYHKDPEAILLAGEEAICRAEGCSWWDWDVGSSIFFWRWPEFYQDIA